MRIEAMRIDRKRWALAGALGTLCLLTWAGRNALFERERSSAPPERRAGPSSGAVQLPIVFLPNGGQTDASVRFLAPGARGTLWFTDREVVLSLGGGGTAEATRPAGDTRPPRSVRGLAGPADAEDDAASPEGAVLRLQFEGAGTPALRAEAPAGGRVSYFLGDDPARWRTDLPVYGAIVYEGLYPGIDLRYEGLVGALKGTYTVAPGADPSQIGWRYVGATAVRVDPESGDLLVEVGAGGGGSGVFLREKAPEVWQEVEGARVPVASAYVVAPDGRVGLSLGAYRPDMPLVVDPQILFSSFLGGTNSDYGYAIAVDGAGNAYLTGYSGSTDFPTTAGAFQPVRGGSSSAFVARVSLPPSGTGALVFASYFGGSGGGQGNAVAVDAAGAVYLTGSTGSADFPTTTGAFQRALRGGSDAFLTKLDLAVPSTTPTSTPSPTASASLTGGPSATPTATATTGGQSNRVFLPAVLRR